jgi:hypothetical protein
MGDDIASGLRRSRCFHLIGLGVIARRSDLPCGCKQEFVVRAAFYLLQPYILKR